MAPVLPQWPPFGVMGATLSRDADAALEADATEGNNDNDNESSSGGSFDWMDYEIRSSSNDDKHSNCGSSGSMGSFHNVPTKNEGAEDDFVLVDCDTASDHESVLLVDHSEEDGGAYDDATSYAKYPRDENEDKDDSYQDQDDDYDYDDDEYYESSLAQISNSNSSKLAAGFLAVNLILTCTVVLPFYHFSLLVPPHSPPQGHYYYYSGSYGTTYGREYGGCRAEDETQSKDTDDHTKSQGKKEAAAGGKNDAFGTDSNHNIGSNKTFSFPTRTHTHTRLNPSMTTIFL